MNPSTTIQTIVPIPTEQIKAYFSDKSIEFELDYANSKIRNKPFLTYLGNSGLPADVLITDEVSEQDRFQLLLDYLEVRVVVPSRVLNATLGSVLLRYMTPDYALIYEGCMLSPEQIETFCGTHGATLVRYWEFLHATLLYIQTTVPELDFKPNEDYTVIEDLSYVGLNVCHLFSLPHFMTTVVTSPRPPQLKYFIEQFEQPIYRGKKLLTYFNVPENDLYSVLFGLIDGNLPSHPQQLMQRIELERIGIY